MNKKLFFSVLLLVAFGASFGLSYFIFSRSTGSAAPTNPTVSSNSQFDDSLPKTEECPINGVKYSKQQREWWEKHRPLGVMVENHIEARPQSGLSSSDIIYEAVAEGGITRFLNVFYCNTSGDYIGPVRSARTYFVDFISEYGEYPLYAHVGGANTDGPADALGQIESYGWRLYNDMDHFGLSFPEYRRIDTRTGKSVATEHTVYSNTDLLWKAAEKRGLTNVDEDGVSWDESFTPYTFKEDDGVTTPQSIHVEFWSTDSNYFVDWKYDPTTNSYLRSHGTAPHIDRNNNKQLSAKTVVVLKMRESNANDGYENNAHLLYDNEGTGDAVIFMDGKEIEGTWTKDSRTDRTIIEDEDGNELEFNRGKIWFQILPTDGVLEVN